VAHPELEGRGGWYLVRLDRDVVCLGRNAGGTQSARDAIVSASRPSGKFTTIFFHRIHARSTWRLEFDISTFSHTFAPLVNRSKGQLGGTCQLPVLE